MKLITDEIRKILPPIKGQESKGNCAIAHVKFFTPDSFWTWYVTEYDPIENICFGFVIGFENEWGYFSVDEHESAKGPLGLSVERDLYFEPKPISEIIKNIKNR